MDAFYLSLTNYLFIIISRLFKICRSIKYERVVFIDCCSIFLLTMPSISSTILKFSMRFINSAFSDSAFHKFEISFYKFENSFHKFDNAFPKFKNTFCKFEMHTINSTTSILTFLFFTYIFFVPRFYLAFLDNEETRYLPFLGNELVCVNVASRSTYLKAIIK